MRRAPWRNEENCANFAELRARYLVGVDYVVETRPGDLRLFVVAPHGRIIEPGTETIARAIAGSDFSLHVFEGIRPRANPKLHIRSTDYDQPDALRLVALCKTAIGIHGLGSDIKGDEKVRMGGLNLDFKGKVAAALRKAQFKAIDAPAGLDATSPDNICNRAAEHGVQLELPPELRKRLCSEAALMAQFVAAVRNGMGVAQ